MTFNDGQRDPTGSLVCLGFCSLVWSLIANLEEEHKDVVAVTVIHPPHPKRPCLKA